MKVLYYMDDNDLNNSRIKIECDKVDELAENISLAAVTLLYEAFRAQHIPVSKATDEVLSTFREEIAEMISDTSIFGTYEEYVNTMGE